MTLTVETASGIYYWFVANCLRKYATDLSEIFRIGSLSDVDDWREMGLRSLKGCCHDNQFFLFNPHNFCRRSDQCVINFVHSSTTRSTVVSVIRRVDRDDFCWQHQYTGKEHWAPWERIFSHGHFPPRAFSQHSRATGYYNKCKCFAGRTQ